jgi:hypothetical protein
MNSRRDGSPFMNLLQCAPLCDSQGKIRYFIGAQVDVSGLAMEGVQMESLHNLNGETDAPDDESVQKPPPKKTEFQELGELFSPRELQNVYDHGGNLFHPVMDKLNSTNNRLWLQSPEHEGEYRLNGGHSPSPTPSASLTGVYRHVSSLIFSVEVGD